MLVGRRALGHLLARSSLGAAAVLAAGVSIGCGSDRGPTTQAGEPTSGEPEPAVSWNRDIAPFITQKCVGCHHTGGIGPMTLENYATAKHYAGQMLADLQAGIMPPWGAQTTDECTPPYAFKDDPRLTDEEMALFEQWVNDGAPQGTYKAPLPKPVSTELTDADLHLTIPSAVDVTGSSDRFVCFSLDPGLPIDKWINAVQVNPGNAEIVHHVLLFTDPLNRSIDLAGDQGYYDCFGGPNLGGDTASDAMATDPSTRFQLIGAWAPGAVPAVMPDDVALSIPKKSRLVMQVHYHPHDGIHSGTDSSTSVDLRFAPKAPVYPGALALVGNFDKADMPIAGGNTYGLMPGDDDPASGAAFIIPAGNPKHVETERALVPTQAGISKYILWGVGTHMHYVGRDMKIELQHADGTKDCLVETPAWDFNWQRFYYYDAPLDSVPVAAPGDVLTMRCTYDNSMDNPFVRQALAEQGLDAPTDVKLGETTLNEMCLGVFGVALEGTPF
jgi:hypothetical protein